MQKNWVTEQDIGNRLRLAREGLGLDVLEISRELALSVDIIKAIENGAVESHYEEIFAIACRLSKPIHEIFKGFFTYNEVQTFFLRDKSKQANIEEIRNYVLDYIRLQQEIHHGFRSLEQVEYRDSNLKNREVLPAILESRAKDLFRKTNIHKLPINVYQISVNLGIIIAFESLPKSLYSLRGFPYKEGSFQLIVINKVHSVELQRFTVAHELHHLLYDKQSSLFSCGSFNEESTLEKNAERFAAELLMPKTSIDRIISYPRNIPYLTISLFALHFNVSYQAAAIRLQKFGLIDSSQNACCPAYRKEDREKTKFLLKNKIKYLEAIFGLETGISQLNVNNSLSKHDLCGAYIFDSEHTKCWNCGLTLKNADRDYLNTPYQQSASNLRSDKVLAVTQKGDTQLSLNLRTS